MEQKTKQGGERLVITFRSTTQAMAFERTCREKQLPGRLIPVPRSISASCGLCWMCGVEDEEAITKAVEAEGLRTGEMHRLPALQKM